MSILNTEIPTVQAAAGLCGLSQNNVEDVYPCTPQQVVQISESRSEVFHLILSFGPGGDMERWARCVCEVVALNSILRTRIVFHRGQYFQVVTTEEHNTEHASGDLDDVVGGGMPHGISLGQPLFRTIAIGNCFVATIHHAVMDYWSLNSFLKGDAAMLYLGHEAIHRAPFKEFVLLCGSINRSEADAFWASRFTGYPSTYPAVSADTFARPSKKAEKILTLDLDSKGIPESHIAWYAEAAWALTIAAYADSESVSYGNVMSGRSPMLGDASNTLGPTTPEIPVQVNIQSNMTVDALIKGRAAALRELKSAPLLLQYGLDNIAATSKAARMASKFQSLFNIVPPQPISLPTTNEQEKSVTLDRVVKRSCGGFALTLVCRLVGDDVMLEALYDPAILPTTQIQRFLSQFEHDLHSLIRVSPSTRIGQLERLNPHDHLHILEWNSLIFKRSHSPSTGKLLAKVQNGPLLNLIKLACGALIVDPRNTDFLVPIGSIGELLVEVTLTSKHRDSYTSMDIQPLSASPKWFEEFCDKTSCLLKTGFLVRYDIDGSLLVVGKRENRFKLANRVVQMEQVEETIGASDRVTSIVVIPKIISGRTRLAAVLTLAGFDGAESGQKPLGSLQQKVLPVVDEHVENVRKYAATLLSSDHLPSIWLVVGALPYLKDGGVDRAAVRHWLRFSG